MCVSARQGLRRAGVAADEVTPRVGKPNWTGALLQDAAPRSPGAVGATVSTLARPMWGSIIVAEVRLD